MVQDWFIGKIFSKEDMSNVMLNRLILCLGYLMLCLGNCSRKKNFPWQCTVGTSPFIRRGGEFLKFSQKGGWVPHKKRGVGKKGEIFLVSLRSTN